MKIKWDMMFISLTRSNKHRLKIKKERRRRKKGREQGKEERKGGD